MEKRITVEELLEKVKKPAEEAEEALKESDGDIASNNEVDGFPSHFKLTDGVSFTQTKEVLKIVNPQTRESFKSSLYEPPHTSIYEFWPGKEEDDYQSHHQPEESYPHLMGRLIYEGQN